jgi:CubicO group peptidase (beta-lactamase class C family)
MSSIEEKLQDFVNKMVEKDKKIYNAILAISTGNGKFKWSGAAGIANKEKSIPTVAETPFFIASITKMFTATIIMKLYEEKKISLDDIIGKFLPETLVKGIHIYKGVDHTDSITIRHLLSHTSGIGDYYLEKPKGGKSFFDIILENPEETYTVDQTIAIARDTLKSNFIPGQKAKYSDTNYQLLGKIIESVTGKKLHQIYHEFIFSPLNLKNTWLYKRSDPINEINMPVAEFYYNDKIISENRPFESSWADGGLISTTDDCLTFLHALNTGKIINKENTLPLMYQWREIGFPLKYGFGTMYIEFPVLMTMFRKFPPLIGHLGSTGTFLLYAKDFDVYFAGTINQTSSPSKPVKIVINLLNMIMKDFSK